MKPWTDSERDEAVRLRREHHSAAQIGRALKRSRNSVIGALHRAGEPGILTSTPGNGKWARQEPRPASRKRYSWERADAS